MPDHRRASCTCCGKHRNEVGAISWSGLCGTCAKQLFDENCDGIHFKTGPAHRRRLRGYVQWLERAMLDDERRTA